MWRGLIGGVAIVDAAAAGIDEGATTRLGGVQAVEMLGHLEDDRRMIYRIDYGHTRLTYRWARDAMRGRERIPDVHTRPRPRDARGARSRAVDY